MAREREKVLSGARQGDVLVLENLTKVRPWPGVSAPAHLSLAASSCPLCCSCDSGPMPVSSCSLFGGNLGVSVPQ